MTDKPREPLSELLRSSSSQAQLDPASEQVLGDIARGIKGNTDGLFALKEIVDRHIADALKLLRTDRLDADERHIKRLGELKSTVDGINLGNERALGAMQELIDNFASSSSLERGLLSGARDGVAGIAKQQAEVAKRQDEITRREIALQPREPAELAQERDMPMVLRRWWNLVGDLGWRYKSRLAVPIVVGVAAWLHAAPSIIDAIKMFLTGAP